MKKFILIIALLLTGCVKSRPLFNDKPLFQVGDCIVKSEIPCEKWERCSIYIHKILEIGNKKYRVLFADLNARYITVYRHSHPWDLDYMYKKVNCPPWLAEENAYPSE
jgi:hypothetical protein